MAALSGLSGILNIATSGLSTAQLGLNVTSNNIANVNTPGYNKATVSQTTLSNGGVAIAQITAVVNRYLQQAGLKATGDSSMYSALSTTLDGAQSLFGDPSASTSLFSSLDNVFSSFATANAANTSTAQSAAVASVAGFFNQASQLSQGLQSLQGATDSQISADVKTVNGLLQQISDLNTQISQQSVGLSDTTSLQNQQNEAISQLSQYLDITVSPGTGLTGAGVTIRASDGTPLTSPGFSAAVFSYSNSAGTSQLTFTPPGGSNQPFGSRLNSGELQGLLQARNTDIPNIQSELSQLTSSAAQALNTASNAHTSVPAPATMTGQSLGIDVASAIQTFSGKTTLNIVNSAGVVQSSVAIDFSAGTLTPSGGAAVAFTGSNFISKLNTALGGAATVTANGTGDGLSITAGGGSNAGLVFYNDPTTPSNSGGKSFSQYFGLNNLVSSSVVTDYNTGLASTSTSGYTSGAISFQLRAANGASVATVNFTPPSSGTIGGLVTALNNTSTGLGAYGSFSLDSKGALSFTPSAGSGLSLGVTSDTTTWNGTGLPLTRLFGLDSSFAQVRAQDFSVNSTIASSPAKLQTATFNASATTTAAILAGDTSGLDALAQAGQASMTFPAAGGIAQVTQSLSTYASTVSGQIGDVAATADSKKTSAAALASEAAARLSASDGVNLDNELINLTTYQQAYSASARLVSAAQSMYQTLLGMVQ